jgi:hypothetical protein
MTVNSNHLLLTLMNSEANQSSAFEGWLSQMLIGDDNPVVCITRNDICTGKSVLLNGIIDAALNAMKEQFYRIYGAPNEVAIKGGS